MLWIPTKQTRKAIARIKRLQRRRRIARILLFLFVLFGLTTAVAPSGQALLIQVDQITAPYQFDFVDWESTAVLSVLGRQWVSPALSNNQTEQTALVYQFLDQGTRIRQLEQELNRHYAGAATQSATEIMILEQELTTLKTVQADLQPQVEIILSHQVETILNEEGFVVGDRVFPPVTFRFIDPPTALILSPRDRIINQHFIGLQPGLDNKTRFEIEANIDQRGDVSSYVTNVGGLGSYPTMVVNHPNLIWLTEVIAHEWAHNYFFTFPSNLAWGYQTYPKLTTINETTADIIGKEIGRKAILRFYPELTGQLPPLANDGQPAPAQPSEFHLAMRRIRLKVDRLLAEGHIEVAETYMEQERQKLVAQGYNLRKLNQAYFAFHGSYALSPASVDPLGSQLRQLRAASPSLKTFVDRAAWLNSYEDYLNWLAETGLE